MSVFLVFNITLKVSPWILAPRVAWHPLESDGVVSPTGSLVLPGSCCWASHSLEGADALKGNPAPVAQLFVYNSTFRPDWKN